MCGIIGYIGHQKASPILINGLLRLEYRGYDSAGISTIEKNGLSVMKDKGRVKNLYNLDGRGRKDERLCLEKIEDKWTVYYSERGVKTTNEIFKSEKEACQYIYNQLID